MSIRPVPRCNFTHNLARALSKNRERAVVPAITPKSDQLVAARKSKSTFPNQMYYICLPKAERDFSALCALHRKRSKASRVLIYVYMYIYVYSDRPWDCQTRQTEKTFQSRFIICARGCFAGQLYSRDISMNAGAYLCAYATIYSYPSAQAYLCSL